MRKNDDVNKNSFSVRKRNVDKKKFKCIRMWLKWIRVFAFRHCSYLCLWCQNLKSEIYVRERKIHLAAKF